MFKNYLLLLRSLLYGLRFFLFCRYDFCDFGFTIFTHTHFLSNSHHAHVPPVPYRHRLPPPGLSILRSVFGEQECDKRTTGRFIELSDVMPSMTKNYLMYRVGRITFRRRYGNTSLNYKSEKNPMARWKKNGHIGADYRICSQTLYSTYTKCITAPVVWCAPCS